MKSKYEIARQRIKKKNKFHAHLVTYLVINGFLLAINLLTSPGDLWVVWPVMGWGVGILFHGFEAYGVVNDKSREEELIQKELRRMEMTEGKEEFLEDAREPDQLELRKIEKEPRWNEEDFV